VCFRESDKASLDKIFFKRFQKYFCQILLQNIFEKYFCKIFLKNTFVKYFERFQFFDL